MHRIKELREAMGLTQEALARQVGVDQSAVAKWESGTNTPELPKAVRLADLFHVSLDELLGRSSA